MFWGLSLMSLPTFQVVGPKIASLGISTERMKLIRLIKLSTAEMPRSGYPEWQLMPVISI